MTSYGIARMRPMMSMPEFLQYRSSSVAISASMVTGVTEFERHRARAPDRGVLRNAAREATDARRRRPGERECQEACAKHDGKDPGDYPVTSHGALGATVGSVCT